MILLLHGENQVASRQELVKEQNEARSAGKKLNFSQAEKLSLAEFETLLVSANLFDDQELIVLEGLFTLPPSKRKNEMIEALKKSEKSFLCWEKKSLSKTILKKIPDARIKNFPIPQKIWSFLDSISPQSIKKKQILKEFQSISQEESIELIFAMMQRQIRLLLQLEYQATQGLAPFMLQKLQRQKQNFSEVQLRKAHQKLFEIDKKLKSSKISISLKEELDLWLLNL